MDFSRLDDPGVTFQYGIASETFPPTKGSCVTFSYYMRGLSRGESLKLYLKPENVKEIFGLTPLWYAVGEQGPFWYSHRITVTSTLNWQIAFSAVADKTRYGLIAIDDIMVEIDKPCPPAGKCDFEVQHISFSCFINNLKYVNIIFFCLE